VIEAIGGLVDLGSDSAVLGFGPGLVGSGPFRSPIAEGVEAEELVVAFGGWGSIGRPSLILTYEGEENAGLQEMGAVSGGWSRFGCQ
jgi:hypothetical protein